MGAGVHFSFGDPLQSMVDEYSGSSRGETLCVLPDSFAVREMTDYLLERDGFVDSSLFMTFDELSSRIVLEARGVKPVVLPDQFIQIIAREIVDELDFRKGSKNIGGFADALLKEFSPLWPNIISSEGSAEELLRKGSDGSSMENARTSILSEFSRAYQARMNQLAGNGFYDRYLLVHDASKNAECLLHTGVRRIVVAGLVFADSVLMKLLKNLASVAEVAIFFRNTDIGWRSVQDIMRAIPGVTSGAEGRAAGHGAATRDIFGAPDMRRELREVARRIVAELSGHDLRQSDFAVVARSAEEYREDAIAIFAEYGLRVDGEGRKKLSSIRHYSFLACVLDLLNGPVTKSKVMRLLEHDFFASSGERLAEVEESVAHLPEDFPNGGNFEAFDPIGRVCGVPFSGWFQALRKKASERMAIDYWVVLAREILRAASTALLTGEEYSGSSALTDCLRELSSLSKAGEMAFTDGKITLAQFSEMLESYVDSSYFKTVQAGSDSILFTDAGLLYFRKFRHVFMIGMNEDVFPDRVKDGVFLRQSAIDSISRNGISLRSSTEARNSIEGHAFESVIASSDIVTFSYVYSDEKGRRILPSTFVLQLMEKNVGREDLIESIESKSLEFSSFYPEEGVVWNARETERIRAALSSSGADESEVLKNAPAEFITDIGGILERKRIADADPLEWRFKQEKIREMVKDRILSATDLSEYSKCPFRYVATRILNANRTLPPLNPMDRGSQMHEILHRFYEKHGLGFIRTGGKEKVRKTIEDFADRYFDEIYGRRDNRNLLFTVHVEDVKASLSAFVDGEVDAESRMGGEIRGLEKRFGYNGQKAFSLGQHRFRGVIDRVETVDSKSGEMIVYDYKSGRPDVLTRRYFRAGSKLIDFGIPLYAVYLDEVEGARLAGAFYYMLLKSEGTPDKAGIVKRDSMGRLFPVQERRRAYFSILGEEQFAAELSRYRSEIIAVADNISAGNFPVTPMEGECEHCEYFTVCRYGGQLK